ncbi:Adenylyl/guanylyl cyclase domain-containing protein, GAF and PAS domains-containing [Desulfonema limicola]|uniref:Adenylyl/guanylyl cyclase domain-containing protein, GAF and PAS domains-containing n=1 Tax=Desulfonema limicola TaxID=45656 RepID=A0A975B9N8_9BACT|nr:GAF domain-containing protein [Desulfonema limicola]QTA81496.1 Adenylyl/guanylyl cyclase domain-containing protein, GAF and PAS domains-containing [Desulfonema limicola]
MDNQKKQNIDNSEIKGDAKRAEMLLNVAQTMAAFDTLDEMLEALVEIISKEVIADRGTIYLYDSETDELYSRVATGNYQREIRLSAKSGVAGHVFNSGKGTIVHDAYSDKHFDRSVDEKFGGFVTKSLLSAPIRTNKGEVIGVAQALNKLKGDFTEGDLELLEAMTTQASVALQTIQFIEKIKKTREQEMEFFDVVSDVISEIDLGTILNKVMSQARKMLNADRSTLFLNDEKTDELFSQVGEGLGATQIRLPNNMGIAGAVFTSGKSVNIPHAYADLRFNPAFDKKTGFFTRSILCVPVINKKGKTIGVTQVLNKKGGAFTDEDEFRLRAFTGQISIALENAKLFNDVQKMKNYSEGMLESMSNGVITINEYGKIITCNAAGQKIMHINSEQDIIERNAEDFFTDPNSWVLDKIKRVEETQESEVTMDAVIEFGGEKKSVNITVLPLTIVEQKKQQKLGSMIMIEDISNEKRMKTTMARYMNPEIADQLLGGGEDILGGKDIVATCLFSDIRGFTSLTEELGAQGTVSLLNEYFTIMVECIQKEGGMLDKFIGDAIMAAFGVPIAREGDEDRGMRAAISMIKELNVWNKERIAHGKKPVDMGIGINTDTVVTGNIGSPKRMDYTMIGDGVNLASRLESACKQYYSRILISENTYRKLVGTYRIREIDKVIVKGKTEPVSIYEVLDYHTDETFPNLRDVTRLFKDGLEQYRNKKWDSAGKTFHEALRLNPKDKLAQMYIDRCAHFKASPPGDDWNGEWVMTSK